MSQQDLGAQGVPVSPQTGAAASWLLIVLACVSAVALFAIAFESAWQAVPAWIVAPVIGVGVVSLALLPRWDSVPGFPFGSHFAKATQVDAHALALQLGEDCTVIRDARVGDLVISQLVVAPSGLFALETQTAKRVEATEKCLSVNGRPCYGLISEVRDHAMAVREHLRAAPGGRAVFVTPVLAFTCPSVKSAGRCRGVHVMPAEQVADFILSDKPRLDAAGRAWAIEALNAK